MRVHSHSRDCEPAHGAGMIPVSRRQRKLGAAQYTADVAIYLEGPNGHEVEIEARATTLFELAPGSVSFSVDCVEWDDFTIDGDSASEAEVVALIAKYGDRATRALADYDDDAVQAAIGAAEDAELDRVQRDADYRRECWR